MFVIQRATGTGAFSAHPTQPTISSALGKQVSFVDTSVVPKQSYVYRISTPNGLSVDIPAATLSGMHSALLG